MNYSRVNGTFPTDMYGRSTYKWSPSLSLSLSQAYVKMKDMRMRTLSRTIMVIIHMDALPRGYKGVVIVLHYMKNMCDWTQSASAERSGEW